MYTINITSHIQKNGIEKIKKEQTKIDSQNELLPNP